MESVHIEAVRDREEKIVAKEETILYQYESGRIPGTDHKSLKNQNDEIGHDKIFHAYVLYLH